MSPSLITRLARDAVHELVVDGDADRRRVGRLEHSPGTSGCTPRRAYSLRTILSSSFDDHAGLRGLDKHLQRLADDAAGLAHDLDLFVRLDRDHSCRTPSRHGQQIARHLVDVCVPSMSTELARIAVVLRSSRPAASASPGGCAPSPACRLRAGRARPPQRSGTCSAYRSDCW